MKKAISLLLAIMLAAVAFAGCAAQTENIDETGEAQTQTDEQTAAGENADGEDGFPLLGLIINDDGTDDAYMTMYGFLHTAETLGYAAKVYRAVSPAEAENAVKTAQSDGVDGLMIYSPNGENDTAASEAAATEMFVVMPYYPCSVQGLDCNVVADDTDYYDELARGIAERMTERSLKSGRILVYGRDTQTCLSMFAASISESYPQFTVSQCTRTAADDEGAIAELANYLLYNRDVKGLYVIDADASSIAVKARSEAQKLFRNNGAPTPTPTPSQDTAATPEATPNPGILTQISVTIFCNGLSDDNYKLFEDNDIFALLIEPYYEAAAQATMTLDKLIRGENTASVSRVNRPLVYADTAEKYKAIYDEMKIMFGLTTDNGQ